MIPEKNLQTLLKLRAQIEHVIFKEFIRDYDMPKGIKQPHAITMMILQHRKALSMSELSYALNMEKGSFTTVADKLMKLGYVINERSTEDRRVYHLRLTEQGKAFAEAFASAHLSYIDGLFSEMDVESRERLYDAIEVVSKAFEGLGAVREKIGLQMK